MLKRTDNNSQDLFAVYYLVYGSLAGGDVLVKAIFWAGPYPDFISALKAAENLKITHEQDDSFVVRKYLGEAKWG